MTLPVTEGFVDELNPDGSVREGAKTIGRDTRSGSPRQCCRQPTPHHRRRRTAPLRISSARSTAARDVDGPRPRVRRRAAWGRCRPRVASRTPLYGRVSRASQAASPSPLRAHREFRAIVRDDASDGNLVAVQLQGYDCAVRSLVVLGENSTSRMGVVAAAAAAPEQRREQPRRRTVADCAARRFCTCAPSRGAGGL